MRGRDEPREKPLGTRMRTNNKLNSHMTLNLGNLSSAELQRELSSLSYVSTGAKEESASDRAGSQSIFSYFTVALDYEQSFLPLRES